PVGQVAYASGFRSLSRFNAVFRERYRMAPTDLRRNGAERPAPDGEMLRLTLSYRAPFAWDALLATLGRECVAGVEFVDGRRYGRTVSIDGHVGVVFVADAAADRRRSARSGASHVCVAISGSLVPVLMPLIARLRQLLDLDAEPAVIDECLSRGGARGARRRETRREGAGLVRRRRGGPPGAAARWTGAPARSRPCGRGGTGARRADRDRGPGAHPPCPVPGPGRGGRRGAPHLPRRAAGQGSRRGRARPGGRGRDGHARARERRRRHTPRPRRVAGRRRPTRDSDRDAHPLVAG